MTTQQVEILKNLRSEYYGSDLGKKSKAEKEALSEAIKALEERDELRTVLDAWHTAFGTTQLTHALDRLQVAEALRAKINEKKII